MPLEQSHWDFAIGKMDSGLNLETDEIQEIMRAILSGESDIENIKKFLLSLKAKGETSDEVGALVAEMYAHSAPISISERAVDTVGTGGDGAHTINISTTAAIIAAAAGSPRTRCTRPGRPAASSRGSSPRPARPAGRP